MTRHLQPSRAGSCEAKILDLVPKCQLEGTTQTRWSSSSGSDSPAPHLLPPVPPSFLPSSPHPSEGAGPALSMPVSSPFLHPSLTVHCSLLSLLTQMLLGRTRSSVRTLKRKVVGWDTPPHPATQNVQLALSSSCRSLAHGCPALSRKAPGICCPTV